MNNDFRPSGTSGGDDNESQNQNPSSFRTPDEVAASEPQANKVAEPPKDTRAIIDEMNAESAEPEKQGGSGWRQKLQLHWPPGKKEIIVAIVLVLAIGGGTAFALTRNDDKKAVIAPIKKVEPKKSNTVASQLSGMQVDPSANQRPVTGVMIENSMQARPQSGLSAASVVFEAIAEGGITRFLALYQETAPESVGPVRSARPYYVHWDMGFDAPYAHVGGSPEALAGIRAWGVKDLDQFGNPGAYQRISSRSAPHNVYTSIPALNQLEAAKGFTSSTFTSLLRKKPAPSKAPNAGSIDFNISGPLYNVHYDYVAATNSYNRSEGGAPHVDANGSVQISPNVVVALILPYSIAADGHSQYGTIGSGQAYIFQDGTVTPGTWTKTADKAQITFADAAGKPLKLNPGPTWFTALSGPNQVSYKL